MHTFEKVQQAKREKITLIYWTEDGREVHLKYLTQKYKDEILSIVIV